MSDMMTTHEVAAYLRIKERRIYELVRTQQIPFTRATGKLLFSRSLIDRWMAAGTARSSTARTAAATAGRPPVIAGSRDPLLDWAARESGSGLAVIAGGSLDGLRRFVRGEALVASLHLFDPPSGDWNAAWVRREAPDLPCVLVEFARREQGLILPPANPLGLAKIADLIRKRARIVRRQSGAGARELLDHLLREACIDPERPSYAEETASTGQEVGQAVLDNRADTGLATRAVARQFHLDFLPLATERFDLLVGRRDYFEPPFQKLFGFARGEACRAKAKAMTGYDLSGLGTVRYNGP